MNNKPAISVIIPAHNASQYLDRCLSAIEKSTYTSYEIIVVDDGSLDDTSEIGYKNGAKVFITDINSEAVGAVVKEIGEGCLGLAADVTIAGQVEKVVSTASNAFGGRIDILINVAGIIGQGKVEEITE